MISFDQKAVNSTGRSPKINVKIVFNARLVAVNYDDGKKERTKNMTKISLKNVQVGKQAKEHVNIQHSNGNNNRKKLLL